MSKIITFFGIFSLELRTCSHKVEIHKGLNFVNEGQTWSNKNEKALVRNASTKSIYDVFREGLQKFILDFSGKRFLIFKLVG